MTIHPQFCKKIPRNHFDPPKYVNLCHFYWLPQVAFTHFLLSNPSACQNWGWGPSLLWWYYQFRMVFSYIHQKKIWYASDFTPFLAILWIWKHLVTLPLLYIAINVAREGIQKFAFAIRTTLGALLITWARAELPRTICWHLFKECIFGQ